MVIEICFGQKKNINKMINKKNILKHARNFNDIGISSAKNFVPDWYKNGKKFLEVDSEKEIKRLPLTAGFKVCSPFLDAITSGYIIPLTQDIAIEQTDGGPSISYDNRIGTPITLRDSAHNITLPTPPGTSKLHFVWHTAVTFKIPKGYSALLTHPLNRFDLPFITSSGVIDGEYSVPPGNVPVFISSTFEGIIPMGTPIIQITLFKTENWSSEEDPNILQESSTNNRRALSTHGWYKKTKWKKKLYN
jgi:hypothetical protein